MTEPTRNPRPSTALRQALDWGKLAPLRLRAKIVADVTGEIVRAQDITTVMVTHDLGHALSHTDRVLMMHRGKVVMDLSGEKKAALDMAELAVQFERLVGEALPDRTLLAAAS